MKKLIFLLLCITGIAYGQARQAFPDSIAAHRTEINALTDSTEAFSDTLTQHRTEINNLSAGFTLTGDLSLGDDDKIQLGASNDMYMLHNSGADYNQIISASKRLQLYTVGDYPLDLMTNTNKGWQIDSVGNFWPKSNNTYDIGRSNYYVDSVYVADLKLSGSIHSVDDQFQYFGTDKDFYMRYNNSSDLSTIVAGACEMQIYTTGANVLKLMANTNKGWQVDANGNFTPLADATYDLGSYSTRPDSIYADDLDVTTSIAIGDANITETELEILDGATVTTSELNILDGVTATYDEINALDGITSTVAELNYTDGVTSAIQTQLDAKLAKADVGDSIKAVYQTPVNWVLPNPQTNETHYPINIGDADIDSVKAYIYDGTSVTFNIGVGSGIAASTELLSSDATVSTGAGWTNFTSYLQNDTVTADQMVFLDIKTVVGNVDVISVFIKFKAN